MIQPHTEQLLARLGDSDLSSLVALAALVDPALNGGWLSAGALASEIQERYGALATHADASPGLIGPHWEAPGDPGGETVAYVEHMVVPRLLAAGLAETAPAPGGGAGTVVRLAPALADDRERLRAEIDRRIHAGPPSEQHPHAPVPERRAVGGSTLSARGLVKVYRKRRVVNDVEVRVSQGEIVGLLGPNGAGKTTTFYMMVGLIAPDQGRVAIGAEDVTSVPMYRRARKGIGYLAQEPSIFRKLTVEENVRAILQMLDLSRAEQKQRLEQLLDELGIKHLRHSKAFALSGGERRRLEITRALVGDPKFMLLDEPFAGVDPIAVHDIQQIVADLRRRNIGVLISDHNVEQTLDIVDRAYIMYDGRVRVSGTVSELVWNDEVAEIYLGPTLTARMRQRYSHPD